MPLVRGQISNAQELSLAKDIIAKHGMSSLDYFKAWKDKSYFFSASEDSFLAYRLAGGFAIVLADPLGPEEEREELLNDFKDFCKIKKLKMAFFEVSEDYLNDYEELGLNRLKIGDEAIIELDKFHLDGKKNRRLRCDRNRLDKHGYCVESYKANEWDHIYKEVKAISDQWLAQPNKREMTFALGDFEENYMKSTDLYVVRDENKRIVAFLNLVPSGEEGEVVVDLMRRLEDTQHGVMDYLYIKTFLDLKDKGYKKVSIGLAPMSGFSKEEKPNVAEKTIHGIFKNLNFLFSYQGLRTYKDKYASDWQPRYLIYQDMHDLLGLALAVHAVFHMTKEPRPLGLNALSNIIRHRN